MAPSLVRTIGVVSVVMALTLGAACSRAATPSTAEGRPRPQVSPDRTADSATLRTGPARSANSPSAVETLTSTAPSARLTASRRPAVKRVPSSLSPGGAVGSSPSGTTGLRTDRYDGSTLYQLPGLSFEESNQAYRYLAIVSGSEPGENGHPGLTGVSQAAVLAHLTAVSQRVSRDLGGRGLLDGDGRVDDAEAYLAKALGSALYRPFYAKKNRLTDDYGKNWADNLRVLVQRRGGVSADSIAMLLARARNGQPLARSKNGARESFSGIGAVYTPQILRTSPTFSRAPSRLRAILDAAG